MTSMKKPLSPHLQIYKPQITSITSILHRLTGLFLYLGVLLISWLIVYYTYQINVSFDSQVPVCDCQITKFFIYAVSIAWTFSLYYHLCNGIRHLFWDIGKGFDIQIAKRNAVLVIAASVALTIASVSFVVLFKLM